MTHLRKILPFILSVGLWMHNINAVAQVPDTLSPEALREIVLRNHPVAKQADIIIQKAKADISIARAGFDPVLQHQQSEKTFDGTAYYRYSQPELKIPTWFGIDLVAGTENLSGNRTDPQETKGRSNYAGISIPLVKNLLMDKRRAALKTAQLFKSASELEKKAMLNDLLYESMNAYWHWVSCFQDYLLMRDVVKVNQQRMEWVVKTYQLGERPAIDTIEALSQLQSFQFAESQALLEFKNATILLSAYLWNGNGEPVILPDQVIPAKSILEQDAFALQLPQQEALVRTALLMHPELKQYDYKLSALGIEKRLKFQDMLPVVNFKYNQLGKGYDLLKQTGPLFQNNFRYGISVSMPLRLSEGRGGYRKAQLKLKETQWDQELKSLRIVNKIKTAFNEMETLRSQLHLQETAFRNFNRLLKAEETRLLAGESSLFLVNARENKALEARQKWQQLRIKFLKSLVSVQWAAGQLFQ